MLGRKGRFFCKGVKVSGFFHASIFFLTRQRCPKSIYHTYFNKLLNYIFELLFFFFRFPVWYIWCWSPVSDLSQSVGIFYSNCSHLINAVYLINTAIKVWRMTLSKMHLILIISSSGPFGLDPIQLKSQSSRWKNFVQL